MGLEEVVVDVPVLHPTASRGRYLTKTGDGHAVEGDLQADRFAIVERPSLKAADDFYASAQYAPWRAIRHGSSNSLAFNVPAMPETRLA